MTNASHSLIRPLAVGAGKGDKGTKTEAYWVFNGHVIHLLITDEQAAVSRGFIYG